jgi:hypothetical protein
LAIKHAAAGSSDYPWLEMLDHSAHFAFVIGGGVARGATW